MIAMIVDEIVQIVVRIVDMIVTPTAEGIVDEIIDVLCEQNHWRKKHKFLVLI